ncbi:MAG: peptide ABC transporter substrate-binding protein [Pikeienuella sp.]
MNRLPHMLAAGASLALMAGPALAERGSDGELKIIYWQAPSTMNPYLSGGTKEVEASSMVIEPLARYSETGEIVPALAAEIPTVENGGVAADLTSITWKLKEGVTWADGTPFTAADAVFTWKYCTDPEGGCAQSAYFDGVSAMEALDDLTLKVSFSEPKPFPYTALVGSESPVIQAKQFADCMGAKAPECTDANFNPVGTGPFKVVEFRANDVISLAANENYRDPAKPAFAKITFKGGGDAESAARSVLQTGEFDYAWNLQISPEVLSEMESAGKGKVAVAFATSVERILVNFTNPDPALGPDERSVWKEDGSNAHPILGDFRVRKALAKAVDPVILTEIGYGATGQPTCNVLPGPEAYASTANEDCKTQNLDEAKALLDEAGWVPGPDGVRMKDGKRLSFLYQTSTNAVRQEFQAIVKEWWSQIGVEVELRNVSASVFFGGDPNSPDTFQKFYADLEMYTNNFSGVDPEAYMAQWTCEKAPRPATQWQGENINRYCNKDYDALAVQLSKTAGLAERAEIAKKMNDILMQDYVMIPIVYRGGTSAHSNTLIGVRMNDWDSELWNIADWSRAK